MNHSILQRLIPVRHITACAMFIGLFSCLASAQTRQAPPSLKVGTIKDYPATGLMTGCGNLYFFQAGAKMTDANYVFLARGDGSNAWMNLDGRDVRLRPIKSGNRGSQKPRGYSYAYGQTRVTVVIQDFKANADGSESEHMYKMTITVRKGRAVRIVHAVGDSDC
jgi:hypothetical protein